MNSPILQAKAELGMASVKFPLVGIGASAGGLAALERVLPGLPAEPGFSIVVILHMLPYHPSKCAEVLQRHSKMPVSQVTEHPTEVLINHIYVIAPGTLLKVEDRYLFIDEANAGHSTLGAIDYFFHSLALSHRQLATGVLLSGMGHDGCGGLAAVREQGGTAIVQLPQDAQFGALPDAAIKASQADIVLPAGDIAARLLILYKSGGDCLAVEGPDSEETALQDVLELLHRSTGHDFHHYKRPTILRRLERRLHLRGVPNIVSYRTLLVNDEGEARKLMKDLLIGVTGFFRDRSSFEQLRGTVLPALLEARTQGELRVWAAACSTGQEAYSLAILFADAVRDMSEPPGIHIFASDIDEQALGVARAGIYPESIQDEVPPDSLERYFVRVGKQYRVRQLLREMITFASHNLLRDPPFTALDLVTCRNFMIYLDRAMQRHVLQRFHFSLERGGYLFLGNAESAGAVPELFAQVDREHRIYQARIVAGYSKEAPLPALSRRVAFSHAPAGAGMALPQQLSPEELCNRLAQAENSCEELQSHNEELSSVNAELTARLDHTGRANDDLVNLIASADLATIFVDTKLAVKRFTPRAAGIFNLIARDVGRRLLDITHRLEYPQLQSDVEATLGSLQPQEREVRARDGSHYIVRVRPYRTSDDKIAGAVLTFVDISRRRNAEDEVRARATDQEFLLRLGDSLRPMADPAALLVLGCRMLGERLGVPQLAFAEIRGGHYEVLPGHADGLPALRGSGEVEALGGGGAGALACRRASRARRYRARRGQRRAVPPCRRPRGVAGRCLPQRGDLAWLLHRMPARVARMGALGSRTVCRIGGAHRRRVRAGAVPVCPARKRIPPAPVIAGHCQGLLGNRRGRQGQRRMVGVDPPR